MRLNGREFYSAQIDSNDTEISVDLPKDGLQPVRNDLEFVLPDARRPGNGDLRQLALAFRSLRID
jgi:hypothetical protein